MSEIVCVSVCGQQLTPSTCMRCFSLSVSGTAAPLSIVHTGKSPCHTHTQTNKPTHKQTHTCQSTRSQTHQTDRQRGQPLVLPYSTDLVGHAIAAEGHVAHPIAACRHQHIHPSIHPLQSVCANPPVDLPRYDTRASTSLSWNGDPPSVSIDDLHTHTQTHEGTNKNKDKATPIWMATAAFSRSPGHHVLAAQQPQEGALA